jgi:hypothetical protein
MTLEDIRKELGQTQEGMAELRQCGYVGYKRWATNNSAAVAD